MRSACSRPWAAQLNSGLSSEDPPQPQGLHRLTLFCIHMGMDASPGPREFLGQVLSKV